MISLFLLSDIPLRDDVRDLVRILNWHKKTNVQLLVLAEGHKTGDKLLILIILDFKSHNKRSQSSYFLNLISKDSVKIQTGNVKSFVSVMLES